MKKIVKVQLQKIKATKINFDDNTTTIFIPKTVEISINVLNKGDTCTLELDDSLLYPSSNDILVSNWNAGRIPKNKVYNIEVVDKMSNMIKINGVAINDPTDNFWGWVPENKVKVKEMI